jgi:CBS domain-containing protein
MASRTMRDDVEALFGTVDEVMQRAVVVLRPDQAIGEAVRELERRGVSGAPVVEGRRVVGIVSLRDLFKAADVPDPVATSGPWHRYEHHLDASKKTVREAMTGTVVSLPPGTAIPAAARLMRERRINRIPIVDSDGRVRGIMARDDIIEVLARVFAERDRKAGRDVRPSLGPD